MHCTRCYCDFHFISYIIIFLRYPMVSYAFFHASTKGLTRFGVQKTPPVLNNAVSRTDICSFLLSSSTHLVQRFALHPRPCFSMVYCCAYLYLGRWSLPFSVFKSTPRVSSNARRYYFLSLGWLHLLLELRPLWQSFLLILRR